MAREEDRDLSSRGAVSRTPLDLLQEACQGRGWPVTRTDAALTFTASPGVETTLPWPPIPAIPKSRIPDLLGAAHILRQTPTSTVTSDLPSALPACVKPDVGSLGRGFRIIRSAADWETFVSDVPELHGFVLQPLLNGPELRITLCANGTYAGAVLQERRASLSLWRDATPAVSTAWLADLHAALLALRLPVIGVDVIVDGETPFVLDINAAPDLNVHLATDRPRALAGAVLESWLKLGNKGFAARRGSGMERATGIEPD